MKALRKISNEKSSTGKRKSHLRLIRGGKYKSTKTEKRIEQFWLFCQAALWNTQQFTETEIREFKKLIAEYFENTQDADKTFRELMERVCLAKRFVNRRYGRYISKPIDWLNINYRNGLAGTARWYKEVEKQRETVPHYNEGLSLLSRAVLAYCEASSPLVINLHREILMEEKQSDLLQIFMNAIMHIRYFNH